MMIHIPNVLSADGTSFETVTVTVNSCPRPGGGDTGHGPP